MARGNEVGRYVLPIMPSIEGIGPEIDSKLGRAFQGISKQASHALSTGVKDGVAEAERAVRASSNKIAALRDKEADAAGKLRVAEERLKEVREKGSSGSTLARAEEAREKALRGQLSVTRDLEKATDELKRAQDQAAKAGKEMADVGDGMASGLGEKLKGAFEGFGDSAGSAGSAAGGELLAGISPKLAQLGSKAGPWGAALAGMVALTAGVGVALGQQIVAGLQVQQGANLVQARLGIDDTQMARAGEAAGTAYAANFGASYQENLDTAGVALQSGLLENFDDQGATRNVIEGLDTIRTLMGVEVPEAARAAGQLMRTGFAQTADEAFDLITKGSQAGLNISGDWLDTINEYSTQWRKLGLTGEESLGLLSQMVKAGARDTDVAADALKEFSIRTVDGTKASRQGYELIGKSQEEMMARFLAGGPTAKAAMQEVITAVSALEDPIAKNDAMLAFFGTQFEDLGEAGNNLDLTAAAAQFDDLAGATDRAADKIGSGPLAKVESFRRTLEMGWQDVQVQLAEFAAPGLEKLGDWVDTHGYDIQMFLTNLGAWTLEALDGLGMFTAEGLRMLADFQRGVAPVLSSVADAMGAFLTAAGKGMSVLDAEKGAALQAAGKAMGMYADVVDVAADKADSLADAIDKYRKPLAGLADDFRETGTKTAEAQRLTDALAQSVALLPDGKTIVLTDNTPEAIARIDETKYRIDQIPGTKDFKVVPKTLEATQEVDAWLANQASKTATIKVDPDLGYAESKLKTWIANANLTMPVAPPVNWAAPPRARGGIFDVWNSVASFAGGKLPKQALIQPPVPGAGLVQWAEPSTEGEAFIPLSGGERSKRIWAETGVRLFRFADGGITSGLGQVGQIATDYGLQLTSGQRNEPGSYHNTGQAGDFSNGVRTDEMLRFATYMAQTYGSQLAELIYDDPRFSMEIKDGKIVPRSFYAAAGDHTNHVHIALKNALQPTLGNNPLGGNYAMSAGTPGIDPETGESGYYAPDARAVQQAQRKVAEADAKVREEEAAYAELKADAKESERIRAQNQLDKSRADAAEARADLAEAERGKFTKTKTGSNSSSKSGGGLDPIGEIFGGFLKETFGLDGSLFPDISNLMPVKMFGAAMSAFKGPLQGLIDGQLGIQQPGWRPGMPVPGVAGDGAPAASGLPFGMIPSPFDFAGQAAPGMAPPGTPASGFGAGPPPGPVDQSRNVSIQVDSGPSSAEIGQTVRREVANVDRLHTYVPKGA